MLAAIIQKAKWMVFYNDIIDKVAELRSQNLIKSQGFHIISIISFEIKCAFAMLSTID